MAGAALLGCDGPAPLRPPPPRRAAPPAAAGAATPAGPEGPQHLPAIDIRVGGHLVRAEIARTEAERRVGLMRRRDLGESEGMLFVFPRADFRFFWMHDTPLPLSIAYIAADGRITQISDMRPFDEETTPSREAIPYALEMNQGWFRANGVKEGDRVEGLERAPPANE
jgi:uncharacterized membrane protein (UPF0127 family)